LRSNLQIVDLVPEGTVVKTCDFLNHSDTTDISQNIDDQTAELNIAKANLRSSMASQQSDMAGLLAGVEDAKARHRLSQLRLDQMKFEADTRIEEAKLNLLQAELSLKQAEDRVKAQQQIDSAEAQSSRLRIRQAEIELENTLRAKQKLRITAPAPGIVIYNEIWRGSDMAKIKVGDTPWRGQALLEIPDMSVMLVETTVSEVDVAKIKLGLPVEIKLDAYPEPTFHGEISDIANIAHNDPRLNDAKVFDVLVRVKESDPLLKPGMSASAKIIIERRLNKLWIPIESVFQRDGQSVAYIKSSGGWKVTPLTLGARNDNAVVVDDGLKAGAVVALIDPTTGAAVESKSRGKDKMDNDGKKADSVQPEKPRSSGRRRR